MISDDDRQDVTRGTAERLRQLIDDAGTTPQIVSYDMRVSPSLVSRWLKAETTPSAKYIIALCEHFNVSADWLLGLSDKRHPAPSRPRTAAEGDASVEVLESFPPPPRGRQRPKRRDS